MSALQPVAVVLGTRPEAIKLAPVIRELRSRDMPALIVSTGQHREMTTAALGLFGITPDRDLALMRRGGGLDQLLALALNGVGSVLAEARPQALVVQGDTTSTLGAALAAFHARIPVAHVEAGLRSHDLARPFPEEMNRRATSLLSRWHLAPTDGAAANLAAEGITTGVTVTGNTVVDALRQILADAPPIPPELDEVASRGPYLLATAHRRESWEGGIESIAVALRAILEALPDHRLIFATHPNPVARRPVQRILGRHPRARLATAIEYGAFLRLLAGAALVISDSGGVQEEGPTLGVPVLVTRDVTERPEGVAAGAVRLVGTDAGRITREALAILGDPAARERMRLAGGGIYGDGQAARRIVDVLVSDGVGQAAR